MVTFNAENIIGDYSCPGPAKRVVIVDDHPLIRTGLQRIIDRSDSFVVCGEAGTAADGLKVISKQKPEIAIVDVSLPGGDGIGLTERLTKKFRRLVILVLSMHDEPEYALRAIDAGAMGYMVKNEAAEKIEMALRQVLTGRPYLSPSVAGELAFDVILRRQQKRPALKPPSRQRKSTGAHHKSAKQKSVGS